MKNSILLSTFLLAIFFASSQASAAFNVTYLTTTLFLTNSTTTHVVESLQLYVSNASTATYNQDRQAFNLSLNDWQKVIDSAYLNTHILNPKGSISNFTFLPGPLTPSGSAGGYASLTMSYDANNVTNVVNIAPRRFEYAFNNTAFNFLHTASGQNLLPSTRLTIMVPPETEVRSIYPLPDYPQPNSVGQYNSTSFAWFSGEPLQKFAFVYVTTETPQQEVVQYFNNLYRTYGTVMYALAFLLVLGAIVYVYAKFFR